MKAKSPNTFFRKEFYSHTRRCSVSITLSIVCGKRAPQNSTPFVKEFYGMVYNWVRLLESGKASNLARFDLLKADSPNQRRCSRLGASIEISSCSPGPVESRGQEGKPSCTTPSVGSLTEDSALDQGLDVGALLIHS